MLDPSNAQHCIQTAPPVMSALDVVKTVAAVVAIPIAILTFCAGYFQREKERTRAYYHKVVVDVVLPQILEYFGQQVENMTQAGRDAEKGLASVRKTMPRSCSVALSSFSTGLYSLLDKVTERTLIFDEQITNSIRTDFEDVEEAVTDWFGDALLHKRRNVEEIARILQASQRTMIKRLYKGEFRDF